ncbi:TauD/TfdA family dioxygenase [Nocardia sp. NRRL S-836]|uniref:2-ketoglutarate dependent dioxygenase n=1 Tax=Lentzea sp. NRRL S-836 TaxID=1415540 RepID=U5YNY9_9PSEU|nr:TauD/TfdA family dioxygenase [Nocardia sp. NRRL S-836]AGZ94454.1 2-ketoglutarate dependent dioxygenase [Lentzea sp. NRRL S-836]KOV86296.1 hypothetical protein ADL03_09035 [Nocardia sp. NRRL S-836]
MDDGEQTTPIHDLDQRLVDGVAGDDPSARAALARTVRDREERHLVTGPGYFLLSGLGHLDESAARRFLLALSVALGRPLPQTFDGEVVREVRDRGVRLESGPTVRYSDTRQGGHLHTDGIHRPGEVPAYFALHCVRQAAAGGALVLVHVADLVRELLAWEPESVAALREPVHFDTRDDRPGHPATVPRPILELDRGGARIAYLREYIESAHRRPGVPPLSAPQTRAMDRLDALLSRPDLRTCHRLEPGQVVVVNNRAVVHGRTTFQDRPGAGAGRLMLRTWIAARSARPAVPRPPL